MSADPSRPVVLDTSVLVHLTRNSATGKAIETEYALTRRADRPLISTVAEGELLGLARSWQWGERRLNDLRALLEQLVSVDAGRPEIIETYARLYALAVVTGNPKGENDLWIAPTAVVTGSELFTCDEDFLWLHPEHLTVTYIEQIP